MKWQQPCIACKKDERSVAKIVREVPYSSR